MFATVKLTVELVNAQRKSGSGGAVCNKQIPRVAHEVQSDCTRAGDMTCVGILENFAGCITKTGHIGAPADLNE